MDVLCNMSGIFRDSFQNVVELLDDLFKRAAHASEPADRNFIRYSHTFTPCHAQLKRKKNAAVAMLLQLCMSGFERLVFAWMLLLTWMASLLMASMPQEYRHQALPDVLLTGKSSISQRSSNGY